jgi:hypothetical protein
MISLSSRPVGQTGELVQAPRRSTPLPVPGEAGVSLGPAASLEGVGPGALHLCASVCICGQNLLGIQGADLHIFTFVLVGTRRTTLDYANGAGDSYDAAESVAFP